MCITQSIYKNIRAADFHPELAIGDAFYYLTKRFGAQPRALITDIGMTGAEGGLKGLFDIICSEMIHEKSRMSILHYVDEFLDSVTPGEYALLPQLYLKLFADVLPSSITRYRGKVMRELREVLVQHAFLMKKLAND